jgi:hypothetical protein
MADEQAFKTIGNRYPADIVDQVNADAARLDLSQSEWMRAAVMRQLARPMSPALAEQYRRPPTKTEIRETARQVRQEQRERQAAG